MFEELLQEIGFSDKEAKVYLALLSLDAAAVAEISEKADLKRPTVYVILQALKEKGLVSEVSHGRNVEYRAEPPERIETYLERRAVELKGKSQLLKANLAELKSIHKDSGDRPVVRFYEGKVGVLNAAEDIFNSEIDDAGDPFAYMAYSKDLVQKYFKDEERKGVTQRRKNKDVKARVLYTWKGGELSASDYVSNRVRVDAEEYPLSADITVYQHGVWITVLGKRLAGISIHSKEVAQTMQSILRLAFERAKEKFGKQ